MKDKKQVESLLALPNIGNEMARCLVAAGIGSPAGTHQGTLAPCATSPASRDGPGFSLPNGEGREAGSRGAWDAGTQGKRRLFPFCRARTPTRVQSAGNIPQLPNSLILEVL